jgi:HK97 family phage prohead protease
MQIERRFMPGGDALSVSDRGSKRTITGYAAVFDSLSKPMKLPDGRTFREVVRPGAFAESLRSRDDVLARFEHDALLGRTSNGTLRLYEDARGLHFEIDPPDTRAGRDLVALIKRRDITASSFAFNVRPGGDTWRRDGGQVIRELRSVTLLDVSPVAKPAYSETEAALRSLAAATLNDSTRSRAKMRLALAERA